MVPLAICGLFILTACDEVTDELPSDVSSENDGTQGTVTDGSGGNNVWYYSGLSPVEAIAPSWDAGAITLDPLLSVNDAMITLLEVSPTDSSITSPLIDAATSTTFSKDIYGDPRDGNPDIGPVEF